MENAGALSLGAQAIQIVAFGRVKSKCVSILLL